MYYKQPRYYDGFQCIGEKCPNNCCYGWNISWTKDEIDKVLNAEKISPELHELVENSFVPKDDKYLIKYGDVEKCPFQTEEGLCKIQGELGAEYLSRTCTTFPRSVIHTGEALYRLCHMSCPVIMSQLLENKKCMTLVTASVVKDIGKTIYAENDVKEKKKHPEQEYRDEILSFFYDLINDKKLETDDAILLGSLAADALSQLVAQGHDELIPDEIALLQREIRSREMIQSVKDLEPNVPVKISILSQIAELLSKEAAATGILHNEDRTPRLKQYERGETRLREALSNREHFFRNIALQLLFELDVPFGVADKTIMDNYALFETVYACIKLNLTAVMSTEGTITIQTPTQNFICEGDDKLTISTTLLCRDLCQSATNARNTINELKRTGYDQPPNLALLVK